MKNVTTLKVRFLGATNTKPARVSITQTNNNKRTLWTPASSSDLDNSQQVVELVESLGADEVLRVVDNTNSDFVQFVMIEGGKVFPDYINKIK